MTETTQLSHDDKVAFGEQHVDELVSIIKKSLSVLLPRTNYTVEIENRGTEELSVVIQGSGFTLDLDETEQKTIRGTTKVPAWQLTGYKSEPATRWHPEDVWDVPVSVHRSNWDAAASLVKAIFGQEVDGWFDSEGEASIIAAQEDINA